MGDPFALCSVFFLHSLIPLGKKSWNEHLEEAWMLADLHPGVPSSQAGRVGAHPEPLLSTSTWT